ncbi:MAG: hypothetical protein MR652_12915 [Blautia sp.]|uniref:anthrax toxin lethal factor-related metalloendopeptidase n=1 Tax=unclassified Blautia TaxID=2648079 RepID=UPI0025C63392|nr:hypothetical protein [Blautia sp.]MCI6304028.1 hypothetical protein [Blautia sp.]MDY4114427.1 hypothetical protein [Blautia sp.]
MKKRIVELLKKRKVAAGITAVVLAVAVGGTAVVQQNQIPELPSYTDPVMETTIEEEETPLASQPKVNTKTSKSTSTKKVTMKKAATKTYTKALPATSTTSKKTAETSNATVVTQTTVVKNVTEKYTKKSKVKVVTTNATTTVTTTTTAKTDTTTAVSTSTSSSVKGTIDVGQYASKADSRVLTAYRTLGFTAVVDPSVSYSGYYDTRNRKITLRKLDDTIYHELGHFVAFISGNTDQTAAFKAIFAQEKALYTAYNKSYVTQNSSEYFAESFKEYTLNPAALKSARPKTYAAVQEAVSKFTDDRIAKVQKTYSVVWK